MFIRSHRLLSLPLSAIILFAACNSNKSSPASAAEVSLFSKDTLAMHIKMLASDSFEGRRPFTIGETRTVDYIQSIFAGLKLEPANGSSYIQKVPMVEITVTPDLVMKVQ